MTVPQAPLLVSRGGRSCFQDQPSLTPKCVGDEYPSAGPCLIPSALCPSVQAGGCKAGFTSEWSGFLGYNLVLERRGRKLHCVPTVSQQVQGRVTSETGQERATRLGQRPPRTPASAVAPWPAAAGGGTPQASLATALLAGLHSWVLRPPNLTVRTHKTEAHPPPEHLGSWGWSHRPRGAGRSTLLTDTCYVHVCYHTCLTCG